MIWHRLAEEDLEQAYLFVGADSPLAAERLLDAVEASVRLLVDNPAAGRKREYRSMLAQTVRSLPVKGFRAYLLFYRAAGEELEVVRFIHGARDIPGLFEDE